MKKEFISNFENYTGDPWVLETGTNIDNIIRDYVLSLDKESTLHSFMLYQLEPFREKLSKEEYEVVHRSLKEGYNSSEATIVLPTWKESIVKKYQNLPLDDLWDLLQCGWTSPDELGIDAGVNSKALGIFQQSVYHAILDIVTTYRHCGYQVSDSEIEYWFKSKLWGFLSNVFDSGAILKYSPGEKSSTASSSRKNKGRSLELRYAQGRKMDGIILSNTTKLEIGAVEFGRIDKGPNGTKILQDRRKLGKALKDMFDLTYRKCRDPTKVAGKLRTYGILISGRRIEFLSLQKIQGPFYSLHTEHSMEFPPVWDERGTVTNTVVALLTKIFIFKERMEEMANNMITWVNYDEEEDVNTMLGGRDTILPCVPTLTTPIGSPSHE